MNRREKQRLETRRLLAEHALRLFLERGFDETTVEEIAAAAGVSPRTFFLHFATKAAAAFPDHEDRVIAFTERLGDGSEQPNPLRHLCEVLTLGLDVSSPSRRTRYQLLDQVPALRDEDARTDRDYEEVVARYLLQAWGESVETRVRAHAIANAALGVVRAGLIAWGTDGIDPRRASFEILHRMICSPLDAPLQSLQ
jgi:AcrR family transcriptional regulator